MAATKNDFIVGAYEEIRISGITLAPTASDNAMALKRLESMMAEWEGRNICVGYNFEDDPDTTSVHNVARKFWHPIHMLLADRLLPSFGKVATLEFARNRSGAQSFLSSACALISQVQYPGRMPRGSGSRIPQAPGSKYFSGDTRAPLECATNCMYIGDIDNFVEHFDSYLDAGETISAYVLTADTGLTIVSESLTTPDVDYQVSAVGNSDLSGDVLQVKIVATTSDARVVTRIINFELTSADVID